MLRLKSIEKSYHDGESELRVLCGVNLRLGAGESLALLGASGNGKSTLLQIAAGLEMPDKGEVRLKGERLSELDDRALTLLRRRHLGFVFQQFNLLPGLSVADNILFQRRLNGMDDHDSWPSEVIAVLDLKPLLHRPVEVLSGGQQQRVAIARALVTDPELILADEPTGNLDAEATEEIMQLLDELHRSGRTIVLITHDPELAGRCTSVMSIDGGRLLRREAA